MEADRVPVPLTVSNPSCAGTDTAAVVPDVTIIGSASDAFAVSAASAVSDADCTVNRLTSFLDTEEIYSWC